MNKIHNFIGEQIIKYIFRHGGMITVRRKAGAVQVAKVYSKSAYENVIVPALNLYTHRNIKTNADRIRSMSDEELADFIIELNESCLAGAGMVDCSNNTDCIDCKGIVLEWLQSEVE